MCIVAACFCDARPLPSHPCVIVHRALQRFCFEYRHTTSDYHADTDGGGDAFSHRGVHEHPVVFKFICCNGIEDVVFVAFVVGLPVGFDVDVGC